MRYTTLIGCLMLALAAVVVVPSCASWYKATDPDTGREMSAAEWAASEARVKAAAEADIKAATAKAERDTQAALSAAKLATETANAEAEFRRLKFERAAAKVNQLAAVEVADLAALFEQEQASSIAAQAAITATLEKAVADAKAAAEDRIATSRLAVEAASAKTQTALAEIQEKQAIVGNLFSAGQTVASGFGPVGVGVASILGVVGSVFGVRATAKAKETEAAATRVVDAIDAVKLADPTFAAAFKSHAKSLGEWMGPAGVALVNKAQNS